MHCDMMHLRKALWCQSRHNDSFSMKLLCFPEWGFCQWKQARNPLVALEIMVHWSDLPVLNCTDAKCTLRWLHMMIGPDTVSQTSAARIFTFGRSCGSLPLQPRCRQFKLSLHSVEKWTEQYGSFKKCGRGRTSCLLCWTIIRSC